MARILFTTACLIAYFVPPGLAQEECPPLPDTGVTIGEPVPIVPGDIPSGCSPFEILVGTLSISHHHLEAYPNTYVDPQLEEPANPLSPNSAS